MTSRTTPRTSTVSRTDTEVFLCDRLLSSYIEGWAETLSFGQLRDLADEYLGVSRSTTIRALASAVSDGHIIKVRRGVYRIATKDDE